jgi:hypothetical protein
MIVKFISIVITYFWVIPKFIFFSLKKNPKQYRFERHCSPSSPTCVEVREKDILQSFFLLSLSSPPTFHKNPTQLIPTHTLPL